MSATYPPPPEKVSAGGAAFLYILLIAVLPLAAIFILIFVYRLLKKTFPVFFLELDIQATKIIRTFFPFLGSSLKGHAKDPSNFRNRALIYMSTSKSGRYWEYWQVFLTFFAVGQYVARQYYTDVSFIEDPTNATPREVALFVLESIWSIFFILDYLLHFYVSPDRLMFLTSVWGLVDYVSWFPYVAQFFLVGSSSTYLQLLQILRIIRVIRTYRILSVTKDEVYRQTWLLFLGLFSILFLVAAIIQLWEAHVLEIRELTFHEAFYMSFISITTVGYGDYTPQSNVGRTLIVSGTMVFLIAMPILGVRLLELISKHSGLYGSYKPDPDYVHVILTGHISLTSVTAFLTEFYNEHTGNAFTKVVILHSKKPDHKMDRLISNNLNVSFLLGTPLDPDDLLRCKLNTAKAVFLLSNIWATDQENEDSQQVLSVLGILNSCSGIADNLYVQVSTDSTATHLVDCGVKFRNILITSPLKANLLSYSAIVPGTSTLVANMFHTFELTNNSRTSLSVFNLVFDQVSTVFHEIGELTENRTDLQTRLQRSRSAIVPDRSDIPPRHSRHNSLLIPPNQNGQRVSSSQLEAENKTQTESALEVSNSRVAVSDPESADSLELSTLSTSVGHDSRDHNIPPSASASELAGDSDTGIGLQTSENRGSESASESTSPFLRPLFQTTQDTQPSLSWQEEYSHGSEHEVYFIDTFPDVFIGMSWGTVVQIIYQSTGSLLLGLRSWRNLESYLEEEEEDSEQSVPSVPGTAVHGPEDNHATYWEDPLFSDEISDSEDFETPEWNESGSTLPLPSSDQNSNVNPNMTASQIDPSFPPQLLVQSNFTDEHIFSRMILINPDPRRPIHPTDGGFLLAIDYMAVNRLHSLTQADINKTLTVIRLHILPSQLDLSKKLPFQTTNYRPTASTNSKNDSDTSSKSQGSQTTHESNQKNIPSPYENDHDGDFVQNDHVPIIDTHIDNPNLESNPQSHSVPSLLNNPQHHNTPAVLSNSNTNNNNSRPRLQSEPMLPLDISQPHPNSLPQTAVNTVTTRRRPVLNSRRLSVDLSVLSGSTEGADRGSESSSIHSTVPTLTQHPSPSVLAPTQNPYLNEIVIISARHFSGHILICAPSGLRQPQLVYHILAPFHFQRKKSYTQFICSCSSQDIIRTTGLTPIVLLLPQEPVASVIAVLKRFPNIYIIYGSSISKRHLKLAGASRAATCLILHSGSALSTLSQTSGSHTIASLSLSDTPTIFSIRNIESISNNNIKHGRKSCNIVGELFEVSNMRFLSSQSMALCKIQDTRSLLGYQMRSASNSSRFSAENHKSSNYGSIGRSLGFGGFSTLFGNRFSDTVNQIHPPSSLTQQSLSQRSMDQATSYLSNSTVKRPQTRILGRPATVGRMHSLIGDPGTTKKQLVLTPEEIRNGKITALVNRLHKRTTGSMVTPSFVGYNDFFLVPAYASGLIFHPMFLDSLLSQTYSTNLYILQFARKLVTSWSDGWNSIPSLSNSLSARFLQHQQTIDNPFQDSEPSPQISNESFPEIYNDDSQSKPEKIPLPFQDYPNPYLSSRLSLLPIPDEFTSDLSDPSTYASLLHTFMTRYGFLCVGLYRWGSLDSPLPFVFTNPPPNTLLEPNDKVYIFSLYEPTLLQ